MTLADKLRSFFRKGSDAAAPLRHGKILEPSRDDALCIEVELHMEPNGTATVVDRETGRPIQFVGRISCAKWEFRVDELSGRNALTVTLENVPVISPYVRA
ncbi:MAG TPA: hypothetical protein VKU60_07990 [Chloroflexota bacterium]|nr:hypothetical protein [Chloroflexota bacterium]